VKGDAGFTLLEVLAALAVFALVAALTYAAVAPAGSGFVWLQAQRRALADTALAGRRLRLDVSYASASQDRRLNPLVITHDQRGGHAYDELWLLVRLMARPSLSVVHYYLDEEAGMLVREVASSLAREGTPPLRWPLGRATGFEVQALDARGAWVDTWDARKMHAWPRALRIRWQDGETTRDYLLPLFVTEGA